MGPKRLLRPPTTFGFDFPAAGCGTALPWAVRRHERQPAQQPPFAATDEQEQRRKWRAALKAGTPAAPAAAGATVPAVLERCPAQRPSCWRAAPPAHKRLPSAADLVLINLDGIPALEACVFHRLMW